MEKQFERMDVLIIYQNFIKFLSIICNSSLSGLGLIEFYMKNHIVLIILLLLTNCTYLSVEELTVNCDEFPITLETIIADADCGLNNGIVTIIPKGGTSPYQYHLGGMVQDVNTFEMLEAGNYTVVATDANGCSGQAEFVVLNKDGVVATASVTNSGCGTAESILTISAESGVEPYRYSINNGASQSSNNFTDLPAGNHSVLVTDLNNCSFSLDQFIPTGVSYSNSIEAIIMDNCAVTGCHNGTQFPDFRVFENIQTNKNNIRTRTQNKSMPAGGGSLTQEHIDLIACWIDDGALAN